MTLVSANIWVPPCEYGDVDIYWPNYEENNMYYKCIGQHQYTIISCPHDMLFSYVYQECITKEEWFPNPQPSRLPLSEPLSSNVMTLAPPRPTSKFELPTPKIQKHLLTTTTKKAPTINIKPTPGKPTPAKPKPQGPPVALEVDTTLKPLTTRKQPSRPAPPTPKPKNEVPMPPGPPPGPPEDIEPPSGKLPVPPSVGRPVPQP